MLSIRLAFATFCAVVPSTLAAQSLTGEWDATMETPGGARTFKLVLQVDGEKVTGTVKRAQGEVPLAGTLKGDTLTFRYTIAYDGNSLLLTVTALVHRDSFQGTVDFGGAAQADFSATRAPGTARAPFYSITHPMLAPSARHEVPARGRAGSAAEAQVIRSHSSVPARNGAVEVLTGKPFQLRTRGDN